jgi:protein gp37
MIRSRGWYEWNWNPIVGCKRDCEYCYAKKYATDRNWLKDFNEPELSIKALKEPYEIKKPCVIFVCAFADLFGEWIPDEWIKFVLLTIKETPRHTYVFLTKNPSRYKEFEYPSNVYLGVTVESPDKLWRAEALRDLPYKKFCSIEPILGDFAGVDLSMFDWIVAGYLLRHKPTKLERSWMRSIVHINKYQIIR